VEEPGNISRCSSKSGLPLCFAVLENLGSVHILTLNPERIGESPNDY
jgi:hypothetical protein